MKDVPIARMPFRHSHSDSRVCLSYVSPQYGIYAKISIQNIVLED